MNKFDQFVGKQFSWHCRHNCSHTSFQYITGAFSPNFQRIFCDFIQNFTDFAGLKSGVKSHGQHHRKLPVPRIRRFLQRSFWKPALKDHFRHLECCWKFRPPAARLLHHLVRAIWIRQEENPDQQVGVFCLLDLLPMVLHRPGKRQICLTGDPDQNILGCLLMRTIEVIVRVSSHILWQPVAKEQRSRGLSGSLLGKSHKIFPMKYSFLGFRMVGKELEPFQSKVLWCQHTKIGIQN